MALFFRQFQHWKNKNNSFYVSLAFWAFTYCLMPLYIVHTYKAKWQIPKLILKACTMFKCSKLRFYLLIAFNVFLKLNEVYKILYNKSQVIYTLFYISNIFISKIWLKLANIDFSLSNTLTLDFSWLKIIHILYGKI